MRVATVERKTKETQIKGRVDLDGSGAAEIATGIGFLDHMLEQLARHSLIDLDGARPRAICISISTTPPRTPASSSARRWRRRWAIAPASSATATPLIPMDETLTRVALDVSNRPYLIWKVAFTRPKLGEMDTELFKEWFQAFAQVGRADPACRESLRREQPPHRRDLLQGPGARACGRRSTIDPRRPDAVPSTKGVLGGSC